MLDLVSFVLVALAGLAAGVASGLFGVGGGVLMVPAALYLVPGTAFKEATAVSLLVILGSAGIGVWGHHRKRSVDFRRALPLVLGGFLTTGLSVLLVERVENALLQALFGVLLALTGLRMVSGGTPRPRAFSPWGGRAYLFGLGALGGLLSGAFGIGGGILMVPGLVFAGVGMHLAVGTSLVAVWGNAVSGTLAKGWLGYGAALLAVGIPLVLGAIPGIHYGARWAHRLHADRLKAAFGVFLVLVGLWMTLDALR
jgi:uncharacterized membrane protein YfcA